MNYKPWFDLLYRDFTKTDEYKKLSKSFGVVGIASKLNIPICGSVANHISTKKPSRVPSDLDFVTDDHINAIRFIIGSILLFEKYKWYGKILIQNNTDFCFIGTSKHYKFTTSFGTNICVMISNEKINYWYTDNGICVQSFDDVIKYAKIAQEKDKKERPELQI